MAFLIPGRTKCVLCDKPIVKAIESLKLPYVNPDALPKLATLAQRFAHRDCWLSWDQGGRFAKAAYELVVNAPIQGVGLHFDIKFKREQFVIFWIEALQHYRLEDFELLVALEVPIDKRDEVTDFLSTAINHTLAACALTVRHDVWQYALQDDRLVITISENEQVVYQVEILEHRYDVWSKALNALSEINGS